MAQAPRDTLGTRLQIELTPTQLATLDEFQRTENLPSRTATLNLLLEIAFETVTSAGQRFWDKPFPIVRDLYRSSNGDVWQLLHDPASGQMMVRHTPNAASGGQVRETSIESFLRGGDGPQQHALRSLLNGAPDVVASQPEQLSHAPQPG